MGDVVNRASKMCDLAYKEYPTKQIFMTELVYLSAGTYITNTETQETYQSFLSLKNHPKYNDVYVGNFQRVYMSKWCEEIYKLMTY